MQLFTYDTKLCKSNVRRRTDSDFVGFARFSGHDDGAFFQYRLQLLFRRQTLGADHHRLHRWILRDRGVAGQGVGGAAGQGCADDEQGFKVFQDVHFVLLCLVIEFRCSHCNQRRRKLGGDCDGMRFLRTEMHSGAMGGWFSPSPG